MPGFCAEFHFDDVLKEGRERRLYLDPVEVIEVRERTSLLPALMRLDELARSGYHLAGYLSFEAGYILSEQIWPGKFSGFSSITKNDFIKKKRSSPSWETPLLSMGVFREFVEPFLPGGGAEKRSRHEITPFRPAIDFSTYRKQAFSIHEEILSGRTYQINYTFFLDFFIRGERRALFNEFGPKARYGALIDSPGAGVLSFSPELFFQKEGEQMVMKPMKGTAPRGVSPEEDRKIIETLQNSSKERAENSMITDLIRNDLGRISRVGSVQAFDICKVETYPTLHQMTSTVESRLAAHTTYHDIFASLFPSGSVSGAPKLEAMKKIAELEERPRGVYTGAVGFIDPCGKAIFNVAIRTVEMPPMSRQPGMAKQPEGRPPAGSGEPLFNPAREREPQEGSFVESARFGAGSGFVYDSVIEKEYQEALLKSKFLFEKSGSFELIEGILLNRGVCYHLKGHLDRLEKSARYFGYPLNRKKALSLLQELSQKHREGRHKVRMTLNVAGELNATVEPVFRNRDVLRLGVCSTPVDSRSVFCRHKTTRRLHLDSAWKEAKAAGYDDVLFFNELGQITETAIHNIFALLGGKWLTPPVSCGLLPGVMRGQLLRRLRGACEAVLTLDDLKRAEKIILVNSIRGVRDGVLG